MKSKMVRINDKLEICVFTHEDGPAIFRIMSTGAHYILEVDLEDIQHMGYALIEIYKTMKKEQTDPNTPADALFKTGEILGIFDPKDAA